MRLRLLGGKVLCRSKAREREPGLHFYSMNQAAPTLAVCERLGLTA